MAIANTIKFKKLHPAASIPVQMTEGAAGYDIAVVFDCLVLPQVISGIPFTAHTGIAMELPKGYYAEVVLRSSIGKTTKVRLANQVGIIDCDYRGEILLYLENIGSSTAYIKAGTRVAQMIIKKYETLKTEVVSDELSTTKRGTKGSGSTDNKEAN